MNPKGKWVFKNLQYLFLNEEILAIYGVVYQADRNKFYWEARTDMLSRKNVNDLPPCGYAKTEDGAMKIIEALLKFTETVKFD